MMFRPQIESKRKILSGNFTFFLALGKNVF